MKKKLLYFVVAILLSSCLADQDNPLVIQASCHDGIKNQNEEDIDCGGKCTACKVIVPVEVPCKSSLVNNRIVKNGININLTGADYLCSQESDHYEIHIFKSDYDITINFYVKAMPTKLTAFPITPWYDEVEGYASIHYIQFYSYNAHSGEVYVSKQNNQVIVEFCSIKLEGTGSPIELTGRIVCK